MKIEDGYDLQEKAEEKLAENFAEKANKLGVEFDSEDFKETIRSIINDDYVQTDSGIADTINDLNFKVSAETTDSTINVTFDSKSISEEKLVEAISDSLYSSNSVVFDTVFLDQIHGLRLQGELLINLPVLCLV